MPRPPIVNVGENTPAPAPAGLRLVHYTEFEGVREYLVILADKSDQPLEFCDKGFGIYGLYHLSLESGRADVPTSRRLYPRG